MQFSTKLIGIISKLFRNTTHLIFEAQFARAWHMDLRALWCTRCICNALQSVADKLWRSLVKEKPVRTKARIFLILTWCNASLVGARVHKSENIGDLVHHEVFHPINSLLAPRCWFWFGIPMLPWLAKIASDWCCFGGSCRSDFTSILQTNWTISGPKFRVLNYRTKLPVVVSLSRFCLHCGMLYFAFLVTTSRKVRNLSKAKIHRRTVGELENFTSPWGLCKYYFRIETNRLIKPPTILDDDKEQECTENGINTRYSVIREWPICSH